jgi:hypothetical protein
MRIQLEDRDGRQRWVAFAGSEMSVGRAPGSGLLLPERNVSRRHARFVRSNGSVFVEDLGSANGTRVNGERIEGRRRIRPGDLVQIGDFDIALEGGATEGAEAPPPSPAPPPLPGAAPVDGPWLAAGGAPDVAAPRGWLLAASLLAAVALVSTLLGYGAARLLRPPHAPPERASR